MPLRILSYNILNGGQERLPRIANVIRGSQPDAVALLEAGYVDCYRTRHPAEPGYTYRFRIVRATVGLSIKEEPTFRGLALTAWGMSLRQVARRSGC
ncbi:MAG TPA: hypothetical protein VIY29_04730 [Ktedonobacteraceae bacterium]